MKTKSLSVVLSALFGILLGSIGTVVILNYATKPNDGGLGERCPLYAKYDTNVRAWYWQVPANDDYFETRADAINHCESYWRLQYQPS